MNAGSNSPMIPCARMHRELWALVSHSAAEIAFSLTADEFCCGDSKVCKDDFGVMVTRLARSYEDIVWFDVPVNNRAVILGRRCPSDPITIDCCHPGSSFVDESKGFCELPVGMPDEAFRNL